MRLFDCVKEWMNGQDCIKGWMKEWNCVKE